MDAKWTSFMQVPHLVPIFGSILQGQFRQVSYCNLGCLFSQSLTLPDGGAHFLGDQEARPRRHASPVAILQRPDGD